MTHASYVLGDYKVGDKIASGGFGRVHKGTTLDGKEVAIKFERTYNRVTRPYLQHETDVYRLLDGHPCVPKVHAYGREGRQNILVFDRLGASLETLLEKCGGRFSLKTMLMLAPQIIETIEYCHSKGIIHRDLKPDNLLMGLGDRANFVHIIDFGLARRFQHPRTLEHFPYFEGHNFFGTTRFASLKALEGCSQSRRDDLESATYSLVYFMRGRLPWQGLRGGTERHRDQRVREKKRTWTPERLCEGLPGAEELIKTLKYIKSLDYTDKPDYAYLKGLFWDRFEKEGFELDYDYDWLDVVDTENESGDDHSISGVNIDAWAGRSNDKISVHPPSDDKNYPGHNIPRLSANEEVSGSFRRELVNSGSELSPITPSKAQSRHNSDARRSAGSRSNEASANRPDARKSARSERLYTRSSSSTRSVSENTEGPVKRGDLVLVKFLARPTLERGSIGFVSNVATDTSYWHQPTISKDQWHFPYRPAIVEKAYYHPSHAMLFLLPIMQRSGGLEEVHPARRPAFFKVKSGGETGSFEDKEGELELSLQPAWPLEGSYVHHLKRKFKIYVPVEATQDVKVAWHLDEEQLNALLATREKVDDVLREDGYLSGAGSETNEVRMRQRIRRGELGYPLQGDIASLNEEAFERADVDFKGSNAWLPELYKADRRRRHENGYYTDDTRDDDEDEEENVSFFTGGAPGNRRLSCTLAVDPDVIVEAASRSASERGSFYRSPRSSRFASFSSRGSSRRRRTGTSSAAGSVVPSGVRSLRHAVLDSLPRSGLNSPVSYGRFSDTGSDQTDSDTDSSVVSSRINSRVPSYSNLPARASVETESRDSSDPGLTPFSSSNGSEVGYPSEPSSPDKSCSCHGSDAEPTMDGGVNRWPSSTRVKVMIDRGVQTENINQAASASTGKVMVDKDVQTEA